MNLAAAVEQAALDEGVDAVTARRIHDRWLVVLLADIPNRQVFNAGLMLCETAAPMTSKALTHIANVINGNDGYPAKTISDGVQGGEATSTTERAAINATDPGDAEHRAHEVYLAKTRREDIRDYRHSIVVSIRDYVGLLAKIIPDEEGPASMLCDGRGFEGSEIPYTPYSRDDRNGWHDPLCTRVANASKLCDACELREQRWRRKHGLPEREANRPEPGPRAA